MSERYTRRDAQAAMQRLAMALRKPYATEYGVVWAYRPGAAGYAGPARLWEHRDGRNVAYVGAWLLDYNPTYGGCVIAEIANEGGGESRPMGDRRMSPREFCDAVRFALDAIRAREEAQA